MTQLAPPDEPGVEEWAALDDGRLVHLRPVRGEDTEALRAMHRKLSPRTVYQRFFSALPELTPEQAHRFTHVDGVNRVALVAETEEGDLVAVGRYDRLSSDPTLAEVAVVVLDDYQHHGLGTRLVRMLVQHGKNNGLTAFVAEVLMANRGMFHAFADAGLTSKATYDAGVAHLVMPLS